MFLRHEGFRRLCAARDLLRDTSDDAPSVAAVARQLGLSPFQFIRQFAAMFGATPHQFRTHARLERARHLLAQGHSVTAVCMDVGFSSLGSFSVLFRRRLGESPSRFQRRMRALAVRGESPASTETDEAPRGPGATTENIGPYLKKEQRRSRGCIVGRMPADFHHGLLEPRRGAVPVALTPGCLTLMGELPDAAFRNSREA